MYVFINLSFVPVDFSCLPVSCISVPLFQNKAISIFISCICTNTQTFHIFYITMLFVVSAILCQLLLALPCYAMGRVDGPDSSVVGHRSVDFGRKVRSSRILQINVTLSELVPLETWACHLRKGGPEYNVSFSDTVVTLSNAFLSDTGWNLVLLTTFREMILKQAPLNSRHYSVNRIIWVWRPHVNLRVFVCLCVSV